MSMKDSEQLDDFTMKLTNIRALEESMKESYVVKKLLHAVSVKFS